MEAPEDILCYWVVIWQWSDNVIPLHRHNLELKGQPYRLCTWPGVEVLCAEVHIPVPVISWLAALYTLPLVFCGMFSPHKLWVTEWLDGAVADKWLPTSGHTQLTYCFSYPPVKKSGKNLGNKIIVKKIDMFYYKYSFFMQLCAVCLIMAKPWL